MPKPDAAGRAQAIAERARASADAKREDMRARFPDMAAHVDKWRHMMGKALWCRDGDREWGEKFVDRVRREGGKGIAVQAAAHHRGTHGNDR